ncbi:MAG: CsgG/HfaB family protein [Geobacter sp.]|nr:CsgG/HfaB family protein [Geobacter sp.]
MEAANTIKHSCIYLLTGLAALVLVCFQMHPAEASEQVLKSKLGCVPFVARTIEAMGATEYLTTVLLNELERSGSFEVAERKRLEAIMDLEGVRSDSLTAADLQRLGTRLGVEFLVSGTVTTQTQGLLMELSVLGLRGQRVVLTEKLPVSEGDAPRLLQELALRIRQAAQRSAEPVAGPEAAKPLVAAIALEAVGSTNAIRLRWKHPSTERVVGYMVLRANELQGPFTTVGTVTEPVYSDEQLRLNETYYYRVIAVGHGGMTSEATAAVRGATSVAPAVPIFMNVEPILGGAVLSWRQRPCAGADERTSPKGVRIYRRSATEKEFVPIARVADDQPDFRDHGLQDGSTYLYSMTAYNQAGAESEQSVQLSLTTPAATSGLAAVSGKVRRVPLSWQAHPFTAVNGYRLQRATGKDGPYQELAVIGDRQVTSYLDSGLTDNTTYWYRIVATSKEQGTGGASSVVSAVTRDLPPTPLKLSAAQGEPRRVTLSWEYSSVPDDELSGFYLYRGEPGQEKLTRIAELTADKRSYRDAEEPLKDATAYSYVIAAFNAGGAVSPLSTRANATTKALPATPTGLTATSGEPRRISVRWQKNPEPDIAEYILFRQQAEGDYKQLKRTTETMSLDTELKDGASYVYRLQALDRDGLVSQMSASVKGVTKALPKPVEGLQLKDRASRLVSWQKSAQADVKRYHVYKKNFIGGQKLTTVEATEWRSTESGKQELYVTAEDGDGLEGEPSAVLTVE